MWCSIRRFFISYAAAAAGGKQKSGLSFSFLFWTVTALDGGVCCCLSRSIIKLYSHRLSIVDLTVVAAGKGTVRVCETVLPLPSENIIPNLHLPRYLPRTASRWCLIILHSPATIQNCDCGDSIVSVRIKFSSLLISNGIIVILVCRCTSG